MADPSTADSQWRLLIERDDRVKVCNHVFGKLTECYPHSPELALRERTSNLEQQAFTTGESRVHYLRLIASELSRIQYEAETGNTVAPTAPPPAAPLQGSIPGVTAEHRVMVRDHIKRKLSNLYRMLPEDIITKKAETFESVAHTNSVDRMDYMTRIARGITNVEKQMNQGPDVPTAPPQQNSSAPPAPAPALSVASVPVASPAATQDSEISGLAKNLNQATIE